MLALLAAPVAVALIVLPLLRPGYVMLLDAVFGPRYAPLDAAGLPGERVGASIPLDWLLTLAHQLPANEWVGKVYVVLVLLAIPLGVALAFPFRPWARAYASLVALLNPWVFDRLATGQLTVLAGYALLAPSLGLVMRFLERPSPRLFAASAIAIAALGLFSQHLLYLFPIALAILLGWWVLERRDLRAIVSRVGWFALLGVVVICLHAYWLLSDDSSRSVVARITTDDLGIFSTRSRLASNVAVTAAALQGFWRQSFSASPLLTALWSASVVSLAFVGGVYVWRRREWRWMSGAAATVYVFMLIVGMGVAYPPTRDLWLFMFEHLYGFSGLREPQKALAYVAVIYAVLGGVGVQALKDATRHQARAYLRPASVGIAVLVIAIGAATFVRPVWTHITPHTYPASWYEAAALLEEINREEGKVLVLPWHLYLFWDFADGKLLAHPAPGFFPGPVIAADNLEAGTISTQSHNPVSLYLERVAAKKGEIQRAGNVLAPLGVSYVILTRTFDYEFYGALLGSDDLRLVASWDDLDLYENLSFVGREFPVSEVSGVGSLDDLLALSNDRMLTEHLYLIEADGPRRDGAWLVITEPFAGDSGGVLAAYGAVQAVPLGSTGLSEAPLRASRLPWALSAGTLITLIILMIWPGSFERVATLRRGQT